MVERQDALEIIRELGAVLAEPEDPLQAGAVQPARGAGVPRPARAPDVRRLGVDVRAQRVRLALVAVDVRAAAGPAGRPDPYPDLSGRPPHDLGGHGADPG